MKKVIKLGLCAALAFAFTKASAQKDWRLGISVMPGVATNGGYGFVMGTDFRFQHEIGPKTHFILTTGITQFFGKNDVPAMGYIPVKAGVKYFLGENLYTGGDLGMAFGLVKNTGRSFIWAPTLGLSFKKFDISIKYEDASDFKFVKDGSNNNYVKHFALRFAKGFSLK